MPTYDFECRECGYSDEIFQRHDAPSTLNCPQCNKQAFSKIFVNPPVMFVKGEPTTIGHLADRNTKKMGRYELQDKKEEHGILKSREEQKKRDVHKKINSMTEKQKMDWIRNGD